MCNDHELCNFSVFFFSNEKKKFTRRINRVKTMSLGLDVRSRKPILIVFVVVGERNNPIEIK